MRLNHIYRHLYPWKCLQDFVNVLLKNVVYNDGQLIAIAKPFGVGIHSPYLKVTSNIFHLLDSAIFGDPKFCIKDGLKLLSKQLGVKKLQVTKSSDRFMSGIVLLTTSNKTEKKVQEACLASKRHEKSLYSFLCITKGAPIMASPFIKELVGIKLNVVNEQSKEKEPFIVYNPSRSSFIKQNNIKVHADLRVLEYNRLLDVALVELGCTSERWKFMRTYLSSKACFILGDVKFSKRVHHILGQAVTLPPSQENQLKNKEHLSRDILQRLDVNENSFIPLMIHQKSISLKNYSKDSPILKIEIPFLPDHFLWTLQQMNLVNVMAKQNDLFHKNKIKI